MNIAEEAIVAIEQRGKNYGSPLSNHERTAKLWSDYLGARITAEQVCYMNILQKISRSTFIDKRDNGVDIIGYALNVEIIKKLRGEQW